MKEYTKTGLLLLIVYVIIAIVTNIIMYSLWFSYTPDTIASEDFSNILIIISSAIIGLIGGIIGLIGAILILMGRKEFGEKHRKFVFYAILAFVISIVISAVIVGLTMFMTISSINQTSLISNDPSYMADLFSDFMTIPLISTPISAVIGGLIWIFGLYQLENKNGRIALFAAYICMIITATVVAISSYMFFEDFFNSVAFEEFINSSTFSSSSYTQLFSSSQWLGTFAIFSLVGNSMSNILLFVALYIPYKRITSGELVPIQPVTVTTMQSNNRRECPDCGRTIPFDANTCPYCGKQFKSYL